MPYAQKFNINALELAWLAGLLEGEGSFEFAKLRHGHRVRIRLGMCDHDVVLRVAQLFNKDKVSYQRISSGKNFYIVSLDGAGAVVMMRMLLPLMFGRRASKIQSILDFFDERKEANKPLLKELGLDEV